MTVRDILALQEKGLRSQLELARGSLYHRTSKGDVLEGATRKWLRTVLPRGLWVGHGEIIDTAGRRSSQHDVIVAFDDHPRFFDEETPQPFFFEGVAAVIEVKSVVNTSAVKSTLEASRKLRNLKHLWSTAGAKKDGVPVSADMNDQFAFTAAPPMALLGYESKVRICKIANSLSEEEDRLLDAVFLLSEPQSDATEPGAWCANFRQGSRYQLEKAGAPITGWHHHHRDFALAALMTWLTGTINYRQMSNGLLAPYWTVARTEMEKSAD